MASLIGVVLALVVGLLGSLSGMDRDRAYYATATIAIAFYYVLFAVMGGAGPALTIELAIAVGFAALAVGGFMYSMWLVAGALLAHGLFDFFRGDTIVNPGMPLWWPDFCGSFDVVAALYLAGVLKRRARPSLQGTDGNR